MSEFTFDTSGYVNKPGPHVATSDGRWTWHNLDPFTQGYIEAMFASTYEEGWVASSRGDRIAQNYAFSDLAPETLAAILKDCERWRDFYPKADGSRFWELRNLQLVPRPDFPPLAAYLGDDGRVYLRANADTTERTDRNREELSLLNPLLAKGTGE